MRFRIRYSRIVKKFAFLPIKAKTHMYANDYEWRWLEVVHVKQHRDWILGGIIPVWKNDWFAT